MFIPPFLGVEPHCYAQFPERISKYRHPHTLPYFKTVHSVFRKQVEKRVRGNPTISERTKEHGKMGGLSHLAQQ